MICLGGAVYQLFTLKTAIIVMLHMLPLPFSISPTVLPGSNNAIPAFLGVFGVVLLLKNDPRPCYWAGASQPCLYCICWYGANKKGPWKNALSLRENNLHRSGGLCPACFYGSRGIQAKLILLLTWYTNETASSKFKCCRISTAKRRGVSTRYYVVVCFAWFTVSRGTTWIHS